MELVEGPTLAERLEQGALALDESLSFARQIAEALEEAHEKGIIHRDLKPQNVKASREGKVKVLDFGLAKAMDPTGAASGPGSASQLAASPTLTLGATIQGVILGTAAYMAPEQAKGMAVDKRADIWAFGVVLYEMLTGAKLFAGDTVPETLAGVLKTEIDLGTLPEATPPALRRLLRRCLERQPRERLRDIGDARLVLDELRSGKGEAEAGTGTEPAASRARSTWAIAAAALAFGIVATFAGMTLLRGRATDPGRGRVVRATIELPEWFSLHERNRPIALSPDGARLAVAGRNTASFALQLYLRPLDRPELRPLPGTEGAESPFWSPDGRSLAFFAGGKLKRLDLADGIVRTLCDAPAGRGGAWSPRGFIVFAPSATGPLSQVAEGGGAPGPYTTVLNDGEVHRLPHFLPDGRKIVFLALNRASPGEDAIYAFDPGTGGYRKVRDSSTEALFVAPGQLAFVVEENLMLQPFDVERMELTGVARPIASDVHFTETRNYLSLAIDPRGPLVFQPTAKRGGERLAWLGLNGDRAPIPAEPVSAERVRVSPDGTSAVISMTGDHFEQSLELLDLERGIRTPLDVRSRRANRAIWSPDGKRVAFSADFDGQSQLAVSPARAGEAAVPLTSGAGNEQNPGDFTPDGGAILFEQHSNVDKSGDLFVVDVDGKSPPRPYLVRPANDLYNRLSPDGRWAAIGFQSDPVRYRFDLAVVPFPEATDVFQITNTGIGTMGWLGERELYWVDSERKEWAASFELRDGRLQLATPRPLFGDRHLAEGTEILDYSRARKQFLVGETVEDPATNRLVVVTDWRALLGDDGAR